jgi:branched-chain amino acid transport system substrate-binding protein
MTPRWIAPLLAALAALSCVAAVAEKPLKVGVVAPLTGRVAAVGQSLQRAIILENEEAEDKDGAVFVFEDDEYVPMKSLRAAQKLIHVDNVDALIVFGSGPSIAAAEVSSKAGVPLIAMAFSGDIVGRFPDVVRVFLSVEQQVDLIVDETKRRAYRSLGLVTTTLEATEAARQAFLAKNELPIASEDEVLPAEIDLQMAAMKIRKRRPAATMLMLFPPQIALLARKLRLDGYQGDFFGLSFMLNPDEILAAEGALEGAWAVGVDDRAATPLIERYRKRFGTAPWHDGAIGYDIARLLRRIGKQPLVRYVDEVSGFDGVYGRYRKARRRDFEPPAVISQIKLGRPETVTR